MGLYFEDFMGSEPVTSRGRTITEADIMTFAGLTGDFHELHTNEAVARGTKFGARIAHGALVFSVSIGLFTRMNLLDDTLIAFAGVDKLRFVAPVFIGDTISATKRVLAQREMGVDQGTIVFETRVHNQRGELVLIYQDKMLLKRRQDVGAGGQAAGVSGQSGHDAASSRHDAAPAKDVGPAKDE